MITLGLTGSIGMGKSTVAGMFQDLGIPVHESDRAVHDLLNVGGGAVDAVKALFPSSVYPQIYDVENGGIIRHELGKIVFADDDLRQKLEGILHPLVQQAQQSFVTEKRASGANVVVLDIPLLFETGAEKRVDQVIVVSAPQDIQRERVFARPHIMSEEKFQSILARQMPDAEKRARADYIIETGGSLEDTKRSVWRILDKI